MIRELGIDVGHRAEFHDAELYPSREDIARLYEDQVDYLSGRSPAESVSSVSPFMMPRSLMPAKITRQARKACWYARGCAGSRHGWWRLWDSSSSPPTRRRATASCPPGKAAGSARPFRRPWLIQTEAVQERAVLPEGIALVRVVHGAFVVARQNKQPTYSDTQAATSATSVDGGSRRLQRTARSGEQHVAANGT